MFPSLSLAVNTPAAPVEAENKKPQEKDELLEVGAILLALKLFAG